ncbi:MAG TPA: hypothetical protein VJX30_12305 [Terriglobales bacterium]|nr:hypothetical protein [Terriglobales bacterium]
MPRQTWAVALSSLIQHVRWFSRPRLIALFWMGAVITLIVMACVGPFGWDVPPRWKAIQAVHHGSDPYAEELVALQAWFHNRSAFNPAEHPPFVYGYSPMTLPLLRVLAVFPGWLLGLLCGAAIATGAGLQLWVGFRMADRRERRWLALMLPAIIFFPGLITDDAILGGNLVYLLYGVVLAAAPAGWKRGRWSWYYIAVLAASVFKLPFLALLAFPVLVDKRQWFPSGMTALAGVLIFASQMRLWPSMFQEYLLTLRLMLDTGNSFGFGPAGTLGRALWMRGLPFSSATTIVYLVFACVVGIVLLLLARRVREWDLPRETWIPIALMGTFLLNPRIMRYDIAAITVPMLLIGWRALRWALDGPDDERLGDNTHGAGQQRYSRTLILVASACFLAPNVIMVAGPAWVPEEPIRLVLLLAIFAMGAWSLYQSRPEVQTQAAPTRTPAADLPAGT